MDYRESSEKLTAYREQIRQLREQMRAVQQSRSRTIRSGALQAR
jgi:hypothetical protein